MGFNWHFAGVLRTLEIGPVHIMGLGTVTPCGDIVNRPSAQLYYGLIGDDVIVAISYVARRVHVTC
jgi:hypothetical protein